jgi:hypothetical protein
VLVAAALAFAACAAPDAEESDSATRDGGGARVDSSPGIVAITGHRFVPGDVPQPTLLTGVVEPADSTTPKAIPPADCPVRSAPSTAGTSSPVLVWVDGLGTGKPLPIDRRYELVSENCTLEPRVQGVVTGGTVNVFNDDRALHRLVFLRMGTNDTLQVMPFASSGQVVASERLTKTPGIVEVRCVQHPETRAYIAVFDHPYFTSADRGKEFSIDSVPAGSHTVMSWTEGQLQPTSHPVTLAAGSGGSVRIQ